MTVGRTGRDHRDAGGNIEWDRPANAVRWVTARGASRVEGFNQLENDREARLGGAQRFQQSEAMRGGFGGFRGAAGRGGFRR